MISKGCKSIFPIQHQEIFDRYKQHVQAFWTPEEVSLQDDLRDLKTLSCESLSPSIAITLSAFCAIEDECFAA